MMSVWYSYKKVSYTGTMPYYHLHGHNWYDSLQAKLPEIKDTAVAFLQKKGLDIRAYFDERMVEGTRWESITFMFWGIRNEKVIAQGQELFSFFKDIPGLSALS